MEITINENDNRITTLNINKATKNKFDQIEKRLGLSQYLLLDYIANHILKNIGNIIITQNGIEIKT